MNRELGYCGMKNVGIVSALKMWTRPLSHLVCKVDGCNANLPLEGPYNLHGKICKMHSREQEVLFAGVPQQFGQQCGRLHLLCHFHDNRTSCRKAQGRRIESRKNGAGRNKQRQKNPCSNTTSAKQTLSSTHQSLLDKFDVLKTEDHGHLNSLHGSEERKILDLVEDEGPLSDCFGDGQLPALVGNCNPLPGFVGVGRPLPGFCCGWLTHS